MTSSRSTDWLTPAPLLAFAREVMGSIDLDPCSSAAGNQRVQATRYYDEHMDGLKDSNAWSGSVFINPPYSTRGGQSMQGLFFKRCVAEYEAGHISRLCCC